MTEFEEEVEVVTPQEELTDVTDDIFQAVESLQKT